MAPHAEYSSELAKAYRRGHPIANPQPGIGSDGRPLRPIDVGDVGYISHVHGNFIRMFNVHLGPDEDGQPGLDDLPDEFEPLPKRQITLLHDKTPVFKSQSISVKSISANASGPFLGGSVAFSAASERGAILATPDPIECYDAQHILSYKQYAVANIESWHEFAVQKLGLEIALEDIIFVTGVDRTTSWATAVFTDTHLDAKFGLEVQYAGAGGGLAAQFSWRHTQGALVNSGPTNYHRRPLAERDMNVDYPQSKPLNDICDQSLFVRHIRGKRRRFLGLKLRANGEAKDDDDSDDSDVESASEDIVLTSSPERPEYSDCLDPVLDHILEHSKSNIAIAHDDDLDILMDRTVPAIVVRDGFGILQARPCTAPCVSYAPITPPQALAVFDQGGLALSNPTSHEMTALQTRESLVEGSEHRQPRQEHQQRLKRDSSTRRSFARKRKPVLSTPTVVTGPYSPSSSLGRHPSSEVNHRPTLYPPRIAQTGWRGPQQPSISMLSSPVVEDHVDADHNDNLNKMADAGVSVVQVQDNFDIVEVSEHLPKAFSRHSSVDISPSSSDLNHAAFISTAPKSGLGTYEVREDDNEDNIYRAPEVTRRGDDTSCPSSQGSSSSFISHRSRFSAVAEHLRSLNLAQPSRSANSPPLSSTPIPKFSTDMLLGADTVRLYDMPHVSGCLDTVGEERDQDDDHDYPVLALDPSKHNHDKKINDVGLADFVSSAKLMSAGHALPLRAFHFTRFPGNRHSVPQAGRLPSPASQRNATAAHHGQNASPTRTSVPSTLGPEDTPNSSSM